MAGSGIDEATSWDVERLTAVVFAGPSGAAERDGVRNKNFFTLRGKPVVQHQLDLLARMPFQRVLLVTEPDRIGELDLPPGTVTIPAQPSQSRNFASVQAAGQFGEHDRALVLFGDTPLVTEGIVRDFLRRCRAAPADFHHGLIPYAFVEPFMDFYPRPLTGRTPFHVREFLARLGALSLMRPAGFNPEATRRAVNTVMAGRKQDPSAGGLVAHAVARARVIWGGLTFFGLKGAYVGVMAITAHWLRERGFPLGARVFRHAVALSYLDTVTSKLLGCPSRLVPCPFGGPSLDIDNERDLDVHERYFDQMQALVALQERLVTKLVEPGFSFDASALASLERFDPVAAAEVRRHPEVYREQRRILLATQSEESADARDAA